MGPVRQAHRMRRDNTWYKVPMHRRTPCPLWVAFVALFATQPLQASAQEPPGAAGQVPIEVAPAQVLPTPTADVPAQAAPMQQLPTPVTSPSSYGLQTPEEALHMQLEACQLELRELTRAGRPEYYVRRRVLGFAAIGVGAASAGLATLIAWMATAPDADALTGRQLAYLGAGVVGGLSLLAVGIWAVTSAKHANPYRQRIAQLGIELDALKRQLKEARRARKRSVQYNLSPVASFDRGPTVLLRLAVRL